MNWWVVRYALYIDLEDRCDKTNITESLLIDWEIVSEILLNKEAKKRASTVPLELLST